MSELRLSVGVAVHVLLKREICYLASRYHFVVQYLWRPNVTKMKMLFRWSGLPRLTSALVQTVHELKYKEIYLHCLDIQHI